MNICTIARGVNSWITEFCEDLRVNHTDIFECFVSHVDLCGVLCVLRGLTRSNAGGGSS